VSASKEASISNAEFSRANPDQNNIKQSLQDHLIVEEDEEENETSVYLEKVNVMNPKITSAGNISYTL